MLIIFLIIHFYFLFWLVEWRKNVLFSMRYNLSHALSWYNEEINLKYLEKKSLNNLQKSFIICVFYFHC